MGTWGLWGRRDHGTWERREAGTVGPVGASVEASIRAILVTDCVFSTMHKVEDLRVWQRGMELVGLIYAMTKRFPRSERYVLSIQMRRSVISIPSNLAEGYGRLQLGDMRRFIRISRGSASELHTQVQISRKLGYATREEADEALLRTTSILRMLSSLLRSLEKRS